MYGEENLIEPLPVSPDQIASLCYTSGTTNLPKGAIITHMNLVSAAYANTFGTSFPLGCCLMSYLPLVHIYERICELMVITVGGCIGYSTGNPLVYQAAMSTGNVPGVKGAIFRTAVQMKLDQLHKTRVTAHVIWDALVFCKIHAALGGNVLLMVTSSAPISGEVVDFFKIAFGCGITEGSYGMTENCGVCTHTSQADPTGGGVIGLPQPILEVKLIDLPAMNYLSNDKPNPCGELCVRSPNCFMGYYKDEKTTQEMLKDSWIHTGDAAEVDSSGCFKIIDRVKVHCLFWPTPGAATTIALIFYPIMKSSQPISSSTVTVNGRIAGSITTRTALCDDVDDL
ncbi:AMP-binding enzyme-domain-containing protein [Pisolithus orientalis]|uniref:AMP-binding enzyme-domain-containing protein n=1 Tax=Pisolithus orientalis TaxID=936130 RepID=UPI00222477E7|nr:AMP-binding enzyme-domain-containing protein [Pisolithus orientalis]KAI5983002.1 AMP-binding enzyme-domain-containing protein [Pisolithus orientalis]